MRPPLLPALLAVILACAPSRKEPEPTAPKGNIDPRTKDRAEVVVPAPNPPGKELTPEPEAPRVAPPEVAYAHGWMPIASTGVDVFLKAHPTFDGRGVLIGILDTGIDPIIPGLGTTSTGSPKIVDLRDFSDEGAVPLQALTPRGDTVEIAGRKLIGFGRIAAFNTEGPYFGGTIAEIPLGVPPAADLNGNGVVADTLPLVVTRSTDGWVVFADTDGDGSLAGERPVHDYLSARETFGWAAKGRRPKVGVAANLADSAGVPRLDLVFDNSGHGSHVSGIAAGHDLYGVSGFDGVAPGAQLLGLKIANDAQGGITTTGSMLAAMDYAIRFAAARGLPLVLNMSFGVGNEIEGAARIDAMVDSILAAHPDLVFTISAGNDGPGLSSIGFPGSATRAITIGATLPGSFLPARSSGERPPDQVAFFSARGGELAKPDIVTPGVAYSSVPRWNTGDEVEQGTSMASPHAAGLAALLVSALAQAKVPVQARAIKQALMVTARPREEASFLDEGAGLPDLEAAYRWLEGRHTVPEVETHLAGAREDITGAFERSSTAHIDTAQTFELVRPAGSPAATYTMRSDAPWLTAPASVTLRNRSTRLELRWNRKMLTAPGAYTGVVSGWSDDTLAGPAFRLVNTVVVSAPVAEGVTTLRRSAKVRPGAALRSFFEADSARPFVVSVATGGPGQRGLAFLHEPDGMPYRDEAARSAAGGAQAADYRADARDVVQGPYEIVLVAPPNQELTATVAVRQCPFTMRARSTQGGVAATLTNRTAKPVDAEVDLQIGGGERLEAVQADGSAPRRIPFVAPAWAKGVVVDITMDRAQWGRFTDFGLSLFDSLGRQLGKQPLNYAFGRLQVELPDGHGDMPLSVGLFPGFADPGRDQHWSVTASIRLYGDSTVAVPRREGEGNSALTVGPGKTATVAFGQPTPALHLSDGFFPLGVLVVRTGDQVWTRESGFPPAGPGTGR